jgi:molecular chaperone DnaK (HSP70)
MAVPAKFDTEQRQATGAAFKAAGLKVIRTLEEPTAAAIAYDLHKRKDIHHILVYDFGGGTLDVSILYVAKGSVQVYATDGDDGLGGSDFDMCLYDYMKKKVQAILSDKIHDSSGSFTADSSLPSSNYLLCTPASIREAAEEVKKKLSSQNEVVFECIEDIKDSTSPGTSVRFEITTDDFHNTCGHLFQRVLVVYMLSLSVILLKGYS